MKVMRSILLLSKKIAKKNYKLERVRNSKL